MTERRTWQKAIVRVEKTLNEKIDSNAKAINEIKNLILDLKDNMNDRMDAIESKVDKIDKRIDNLVVKNNLKE